MRLHRLVIRKLTPTMAADQTYEHHGLSGEFVMLPSGQMVPVAEAPKPEPVKPAQPAPKAKE